jgi:SOS-response transcriptional repressor LexA
MTGPRPGKGRPRGRSNTRERLLDLLAEERRRTGLWPGRDWLAGRLGVTPQAVSFHRGQLVREGRLPQAAQARDWTKRNAGASPRIPVMGRSAAGPPKLAVTESEDLDLVNVITAGHAECFSCIVDGDSLDGPPLWILPGSYAICRPADASQASPGDIVVARLEDPTTLEATTVLKEWRPGQDGRVTLHSLNPAAADIHPEPGTCVVLGIAVAILRQLPR